MGNYFLQSKMLGKRVKDRYDSYEREKRQKCKAAAKEIKVATTIKNIIVCKKKLDTS